MNGKPWTKTQLALLEKLYPITPSEDLVYKLGHTANSIRAKASSLGIKCIWEYHRAPPDNHIDSLGEVELAYVAGIIDGEGNITNRWREGIKFQQKGTFNIDIRVVNTYYPVLQWLENKVGGKVTERAKAGSDYGGRKRPKTLYLWALYDHRGVRKLLTRLLPFLIIKREEAVNALDVLNRILDERE